MALALLLILAALGHLVVWITLGNIVHGTALPWRAIRVLTKLSHLAMVSGWTVVALLAWRGVADPRVAWGAWAGPLAVYGLVCVATAAVPFPLWLARRLTVRPSPHLIDNHSTVVDVARQLGQRPMQPGWQAWVARAPGNDVWQLEVNIKTLIVPRLPAELEGLRVGHISDWHLLGPTKREFFFEVASQLTALEPELIAVTGDLVDRDACLDWLPAILARLQAPAGCFAILGNHDLRVRDQRGLRQAIVDGGAIDLGGRAVVRSVRGWPLALAGNESPWYLPAGDWNEVPAVVDGRRPFRVALAHSPDQYAWARARDVDLMLAGHMHGGQVRLPWLGAILAPSPQGVRYASGVFYEPPTVLHVSRGLSAMFPLRVNCRPEATLLVLRGGPG